MAYTRGYNKATVLGTLGGDPEVRTFPDGSKVATFALATSEHWKDKETGEDRDRTEWHPIKVTGKLAEILSDNLKKGDEFLAEGKLQTEKWKDKETGQDRQKKVIVMGDFSFVRGNKKQGDDE